jgi:flagellar basal body-associated protein FliL
VTRELKAERTSMADSKTEDSPRPAPDDGEKDSGENKETPAPKKPGMKKLAILAGVIVVQVIASYFLQRAFLFPGAQPAEAGIVETKETKKGVEKESKREESKHSKGSEKASEMVMLDEIIVNPAQTAGRRFLAVTIGFEVEGEERNVIENRKPLIRDDLIGLLSSKTITQLADITYRDTLRSEIRTKIEEELNPLSVARVVFTGYVLQ